MKTLYFFVLLAISFSFEASATGTLLSETTLPASAVETDATLKSDLPDLGLGAMFNKKAATRSLSLSDSRSKSFFKKAHTKKGPSLQMKKKINQSRKARRDHDRFIDRRISDNASRYGK